LPGIDIVKFFLNEILLTHLPKSDQKDIDPEQHFYLLISLMQEYSDKYNGSVAEFQNLFEFLTKELSTYRSAETFESQMKSDKILVGLMTLLSVLLAGHTPYREQCGKRGVLEGLLRNFLFATGKTEEDKQLNLPKCKTPASRELAYRLVVQCVLDVPANYPIIHRILSELQSKVKTPNAWEYSPEKSVKSHCGFVGLRNLGSTCYMNSLLQQFYMMPHFRNALIKSGVDLTQKMSEEDCTESLLFQLMRMFSFLSLSEKQAFDTVNFCRAYKDETGRPVDVRIQQDAQEFFTILADRLETEMKESRYRYLLNDTFGAQVAHQMICQGGCNKTRERKQPMPMISLPIKNRNNMVESLEAFVQSEELDGVSCDHCQKKCLTFKRQVLHTLPNTIFFHLKRFELNFETFRHEKSNQRFEFPLEIDLEPYTREGLKRIESEKATTDGAADKDKKPEDDKKDNSNQPPPQSNEANQENPNENKSFAKYSEHPKEYYQYHLVGIVVHTGSAEAGHYYSYIKDRKTGEWNEFNDSLIKPFDIKYLDNDCFGGKKKVKSSQQWGGHDWEHEADKIKNAYILVYDRVKYTEPDHDEDLKREQEEAEKKRQEETAAASGAKETGTSESKQEQDNKEQEKPQTQPEPTPTPTATDKSMSVITQRPEDPQYEEEKKNEPELPSPIAVNEFFDVKAEDYVEHIPKVWEDILDTNMKFMRDRQLFNLQYFQFIYNLICVAPTPECKEVVEPPILDDLKEAANDSNDDSNPGLRVIKMATFVCFRFLARTADKRLIFNRFVTYLKFLYESNVPACKWLLKYLASQRNYVEQYILSTRDTLVMHQFSDLVIHVLRQLKDVEGAHLSETEQVLRKVPLQKPMQYGQGGAAQQMPANPQQPTFVEQQVTISKIPSSKFMDLILELMEIAPKHWFRFNYYFSVIHQYALMGHHQRNYLIDRQMVNRLGDFYLGAQYSPYSDGKRQYPMMGNRMYPPKFDIVIQIISILLCACHTAQTKKLLSFYDQRKETMDEATKKKWLKLSPVALSYKDPANNPEDPDRDCLHDLSELDGKLAHCRYLYDKMIVEAHHNREILKALNNLVVHWSYEDKTFSSEVITMITEGVDKSGADQVQTFLAIMSKFVSIDDSQRDFRLEQLHAPPQTDKSVLYFIKCYRSNHQPFSYQSIKALVAMMKENEHYAKYMVQKRKTWEWWDAWLDQYVHRQTYMHNQNNARLTQLKIEWFENEYIPLLAKYQIECQRAPPQQHQMHGGGGGRGYNQYGQGGGYYGQNQMYNQGVYPNENHFGDAGYAGNGGGNGMQPGGGNDPYFGQDAAGVAGGDGAGAGVPRQNSRQDLYDNDGDGAAVAGNDEGGNDAASDADGDMQMQHGDDDDDDDVTGQVGDENPQPLNEV